MDTIIIDGLSFALPLFIMAIGGIYSEKSGITNLALEGFQGFGAFIGALSAVLIANASGADIQDMFYVALAICNDWRDGFFRYSCSIKY